MLHENPTPYDHGSGLLHAGNESGRSRRIDVESRLRHIAGDRGRETGRRHHRSRYRDPPRRRQPRRRLQGGRSHDRRRHTHGLARRRREGGHERDAARAGAPHPGGRGRVAPGRHHRAG